MKLTIPHLGPLKIFLRPMSRKTDPAFIFLPTNSPKPFLLGAPYSPEATCLPFKVILRNFIEPRVDRADTFAITMGHGPCRLGRSDGVGQQILRDPGFRFDRIAMDETRIRQDDVLRFKRKGKKANRRRS